MEKSSSHVPVTTNHFCSDVSNIAMAAMAC
jgi:hypothetical protein